MKSKVFSQVQFYNMLHKIVLGFDVKGLVLRETCPMQKGPCCTSESYYSSEK